MPEQYKPTHTTRVEEVRWGDKVIKRLVSVPTQETLDAEVRRRLRHFAAHQPMNDAEAGEGVLDANWLVVSCPHPTAMRLVSARLRKSEDFYAEFQASELITRRFSREYPSQDEGYPNFQQCFIFVGYSDALNKMIPQEVTQLFMLRYQRQRPCWILAPGSLDGFPGLQDLHRQPNVRHLTLPGKEGESPGISCLESLRRHIWSKDAETMSEAARTSGSEDNAGVAPIAPEMVRERPEPSASKPRTYDRERSSRNQKSNANALAGKSQLKKGKG